MDTLRCLWLAREIPFPANTGDRIYSGELANALAESGASVTYLALDAGATGSPIAGRVRWTGVSGKKKPNWMALFSRFPLVAAAHATRPIRKALREFLLEQWDVVVLDHYGTAWALKQILDARNRAMKRMVVVHVSHNFEEHLSRALYLSNPRVSIRSTVLFLNWLKIRFWERRMTSRCDIVSAITDEDREAYAIRSSGPLFLTLTPGYSGRIMEARILRDDTPRNVVVIGSYRWGVKEQNLRQLLLAADGPFADNGITLHVVGDVTDGLKLEFQGKLRSAILHGFVDDFGPYIASSRIALVPEVVGGGFKLKFLDYIFGRIAVATINEASAGLPDEVRRNILQLADMQALVDSVLLSIDDLDLLNAMQHRAFEAAAHQFAWIDRGTELLQNIKHLQGT